MDAELLKQFLAALPPELLAQLAAALNLTPAEVADGETPVPVSVDQVAEAIGNLATAAESVPELNETIASKGTSLEELNRQLEDLRKAHDDLWEKQQEIEKAKGEAEVDQILASFADRGLDADATARIRTLLLSDRDSGLAILNGLPKPGAAAVEEAPPKPQHKNPGEEDVTAETDQERANKIQAKAREIIAKAPAPKPSLSKAYAQAEAQLYPQT
jgi:hypothetical protein